MDASLKLTKASTAKRRSFSESRATPPRAMYSELSDAHASITRRLPGNWPSLAPGWAKDQPPSPSNPKSKPLESVARVTSSEGTTMNAAPGRTYAFPEHDHPEEVSKNNLPPKARQTAPIGIPEISQSEIGEIRTKSPGLSRVGSSAVADDIHDRHSSLPDSLLDHLRPRSRSLSHLEGMPDPQSSGVAGSMPQDNTMSEIYRTYAHGAEDNEDCASDMSQDSHMNDQNRDEHSIEQVTPIQSSIARIRGPEFPQNDSFESFQAWIEAASSERDSVDARSAASNAIATVAMLDPRGFVRSRPMSQAELGNIESYIVRHLRDPDDVSPISAHMDAAMNIDGNIHQPEGRLSLEYNPALLHGRVARRPSNSSSSSLSYGAYHLRHYGYPIGGGPDHTTFSSHRTETDLPRTRSGTPPLLYGANAIGRAAHDMSHDMESENDWETVEGLSRQGTLGVQLQGTASSHADYSSSSSEMKTRGLPSGGQQLHQPQHPRYIQSWNMLRHESTGETVLLPDGHIGAGTVSESLLAPTPLMPRRLRSDYHHPSPLSHRQAESFNSSPLSLELERGSSSPGTKGAIPLPHYRPDTDMNMIPHNDRVAQAYKSDYASFSDDESSVLEMTMKTEEARTKEFQQGHRKEQSSAWVSTDEDFETDIFVGQGAGGGSFAQMIGVNPRANVTGTPQGTGAREVGSSLANESSPYADFASSSVHLESSPLNKAPKSQKNPVTQDRRTIDSSLDTTRTTESDAIYKANYRVPSSEYSVNPQDQGLTALPAVRSNLPQEILDHKRDLIAAGLLPKPKEPVKRHSVPLAILAPIKNATVSTGAALNRQFQRLPNIPALAPFRQRSPQRCTAHDSPVTEPGLPIFDPQSDIMKTPRPTKDVRKRKVSDGEEPHRDSPNHEVDSPNARLIPVATTGQRAGVTTSAEPVELEGIAVHPTTMANVGDRGDEVKSSKRASKSTTATASIDRGRNVSTNHSIAASESYFGSNKHLLDLRDKVSPEFKDLYNKDAIKVLKSIPKPDRSGGRPKPPVNDDRKGLPVADPNDPHLHRLPFVKDSSKRRQHQKNVSLTLLILCIVFPPLWFAYGGGWMDSIMVSASKGDTKELDPMYKLVAFALGGICVVLALGGAIFGLFLAGS